MQGEEVENDEMESGEVVDIEEELDHGEQEESRDNQQKYGDFPLYGFFRAYISLYCSGSATRNVFLLFFIVSRGNRK